jgi:hypothetical protein
MWATANKKRLGAATVGTFLRAATFTEIGGKPVCQLE